jgi:hypothetical protein
MVTDPDASQEQSPQGTEKRMQDSLAYSFSVWIALRMGASPIQCFDNAWRMFLRTIPEFFYPDGIFVEGWYVLDLPEKVVMNEHGWCELPNGTIIDPTVVLLVPQDQPVFYFPGVSRSWHEVSRLVDEEKWFPYVRGAEYGEDGLGHPGYKAAYEAAKRKVVALANAATPPKAQEYLRAQDLDDEQLDAENALRIFILRDDPHLGSEQEGRS